MRRDADRGRDGGENGASGVLQLKSGQKLKGKGFQTIPAGERLVLMTPGGGGVGSPSERAGEASARDLRDGLVTATAAE